jgi:hypothetical protein
LLQADIVNETLRAKYGWLSVQNAYLYSSPYFAGFKGMYCLKEKPCPRLEKRVSSMQSSAPHCRAFMQATLNNSKQAQ